MATVLLPTPMAGAPALPARLPDHNDLPQSDGSIVNNFNEHPQSRLLTESIEPVLRKLHPDGQYAIGEDSGIYFRLTEQPLEGCRAPDWYYVPDVPPMAPGGETRRSYVMWQEIIAPVLVVEYVSGDGTEERDRTPFKGKFWIYERAIRAGYYAIHDHNRGTLEAFELVGGVYQPIAVNSRGHFPIPRIGVELGIWVGQVGNISSTWLRFFDLQGKMLPADFERANEAEAENARLRELLKQAGIKPAV